MGQMCMTDAVTTQDNFILPAPPVGGLPISQDWLDRIKLAHDRTRQKEGRNVLTTHSSHFIYIYIALDIL